MLTELFTLEIQAAKLLSCHKRCHLHLTYELFIKSLLDLIDNKQLAEKLMI